MILKDRGTEGSEKWNLIRVHEDFRVIALGLAVPNYIGNPLDPPLRSRFQARDIDVPPYQVIYMKHCWTVMFIHPSKCCVFNFYILYIRNVVAF